MGIIGWIILGLATGLIAGLLIPGRRSPGVVLTCVMTVAGALLGGWIAAMAFDIRSPQGFFNASTWLTALAGAIVPLLAYHLATGRSGRFAHR